jgi:hypothetical protein
VPATPANTITPRREIKNYQVSGLINLTYVALPLYLYVGQFLSNGLESPAKHAEDLIDAWHGLGENPPLSPALQFAEFAVHDWDLATALGLPFDGAGPEGRRARPRVHAGQL